MKTVEEIRDYIRQFYLDYYMYNERMSSVSTRMYFIALHYIDRGEY